jgi:hypothetical protein
MVGRWELGLSATMRRSYVVEGREFLGDPCKAEVLFGDLSRSVAHILDVLWVVTEVNQHLNHLFETRHDLT